MPNTASGMFRWHGARAVDSDATQYRGDSSSGGAPLLAMTMNWREMGAKWIKQLVQIELATSERQVLRGPRFAELEWRDYILHFECEPWYFPRELSITSIHWVFDYSVFHTIPLDPVIHKQEGESFQFMGRLRFRNGIIENVA